MDKKTTSMASKQTKKPEVKRTYLISSSVSPAISGYGGFDEWELFELTNRKADAFFQELQKLVEKHGGEYVGGGYPDSRGSSGSRN